MMSTKTGTVMILLAIVLTFALSPAAQPTLAQSAKSNCKKLKGSSVQVFDPVTGVVSGPVTNGGILNGTAEDAIDFGAGFVLTPDPSVVAYTSDLTITTIHGQLKANSVVTQSIITGSGVEWGTIDPDTSTGIFAGATGTIILAFKPIGDPSVGPYDTEITGEICFANE